MVPQVRQSLTAQRTEVKEPGGIFFQGVFCSWRRPLSSKVRQVQAGNAVGTLVPAACRLSASDTRWRPGSKLFWAIITDECRAGAQRSQEGTGWSQERPPPDDTKPCKAEHWGQKNVGWADGFPAHLINHSPDQLKMPSWGSAVPGGNSVIPGEAPSR